MAPRGPGLTHASVAETAHEDARGRYASIEQLAKDLRARRFSAVELARSTLDSLASVGPRFNAIANLVPERALAEAAAADRRIARRDRASPLLGIPYGAKDLFAARGAPTTWGAPEFRDQRFDADATAIARLHRHGAVLAAKLAMVELAGAGNPRYPGASLHGPGRNPWDPERYSGGSSSGSGIAVATGLVAFALGTETGGSILGPAAWSGVTGVRPTYGLVPRTGVMPASWTLDKVGVLARSARDCSYVLEAIAGPDTADRTSAGRYRPLDARAARAALRDVRIGRARDDVEACADTVRDAVASGLEELARATRPFDGAALRTDLPYDHIIEIVMAAEASAIFADRLDEDHLDLVDAKQKTQLRAGLGIRARDYLHAQRLRTLVSDDFRRIFGEVDVLVSAARTETAPRLDERRKRRSAAATPDRLRVAGNLAGLPAIFFPCGLALDGMPVGLQLVGPPRSEPLLFALVEAYQRESGHHHARPPYA